MIKPICHMAYADDLTRCGRSAIRLNVGARFYVHSETEGHRDGSVAFPPLSRRVARAAGVAGI